MLELTNWLCVTATCQLQLMRHSTTGRTAGSNSVTVLNPSDCTLTDDYYDDDNTTVPTATNVTHEHSGAVT